MKVKSEKGITSGAALLRWEEEPGDTANNSFSQLNINSLTCTFKLLAYFSDLLCHRLLSVCNSLPDRTLCTILMLFDKALISEPLISDVHTAEFNGGDVFLELAAVKRKNVEKPQSPPPPSINALLEQSVDLQRAATNNPFAPDWAIERSSEADFKARYVNDAIRVGRQAGFGTDIMKDVVRRIYAFEAGGWGTAETLSGMRESQMTPELKDQRENMKPASSAIGYTQVIRPTTLFLLHQSGDNIANRLQDVAAKTGDPALSARLEEKSQLVRNLRATVTRVAEELPDAAKHKDHKGQLTWNSMNAVAKTDTPVVANLTGRQLGNAIHALHMDKDVGPLMQAENLRSLVEWAQKNDLRQMLKARVQTIDKRSKDFDGLAPERREAAIVEVAELMKQACDKIPSKNVEEEIAEFESRNGLEQKFRDLKAGPDPILARQNLSTMENKILRSVIAHAGEVDNVPKKLSKDAKMLVAKVIDSQFQGHTVDELIPAALELGNLVGTGRALQMLRPESANKPARNFFSKEGYKANPVAHKRTASQLLMAIYRNMSAAEQRTSRAGLSELSEFLDNTKED